MRRTELLSLGRALDALFDAAVTYVGEETVQLPDALGLVVAQGVIAPADMPRRDCALRRGVAVRAADTLDASALVPLPLSSIPARVTAGANMPTGTDAVLPGHGVRVEAGFAEAVATATPWLDVRRAGEDTQQGARLVASGQVLSATRIAAAGALGIAEVAVRRPRVAFIDVADRPEVDALKRLVAWGGGSIAGEADAASLIVSGDASAEPEMALAIRPGLGEVGLLFETGACPRVVLPVRPDAVLAFGLAFLLPLVDRLAGRREPRPTEVRPLADKISVTAGLSNLVLVSRCGDAWRVEAAGDAPLSAFAAADAFAVLTPECEGLAPGALFEAQVLMDMR